MTEQYQQNNINVPRKTQVFNSTGLLSIQALDLDSDLVIAETDTDGVLLQLPTADQIPGQQIAVKTPDAGSTGNPVTILPPTGQLIDGFASITLAADQEAVILKAAGDSAGAGYFWQVISSSGGAVATAASIDLLSTTEFFGFTVDNVISFDSWAALLAALALLPTSLAGGNPLFQPSRIWASDGADGGWFDSSIGGASLEGASGGRGTFGRTFLFNQGVTLTDVRSMKNLEVEYGIVPLAAGARFLPGGFSDDESHLVVENCTFTTILNGFPATSGIAMLGVLELHSETFWDIDSILVPAGFSSLSVECYDRCVIVGGAFTGGGVVVCDILDASANVDIIQPGVTFDLELGSSPGAGGGAFFTSFGNASELMFGGFIDLSLGAPGELIAGGANVPLPVGSGAPVITPPFSGAAVGATITRPGYIRGIGVTVDNSIGGFATFDIEVYIGGVLAFTETGFDTITHGYQYFDSGFGRVGPTVPTFAGSINLVVVPTSAPPAPGVTINAFVRFV